MDRKKSSSSLVIRNLCKRFIRDRYPKELDFFDIIWDIFGKLGRPLREEKAQGKRLKFLRRKTFSALGFTETEPLDLVTPSVIALISAATYHLGTLEGEIEDEKIKDVIHIYAETYGVKRELREEISTHVVPLLKLEISKLRPIKQKPEVKGTKLIPRKKEAKDLSEVGLKIGIEEGRPYVAIDDEEITEFRNKEVTFVRLVLLAAARISKDKKYKDGYVSKDDLFDKGSHETSRIRVLLSSKLKDVPFDLKGKVIKAGTGERVRLNMKNVEIADSISNFQSQYVRTFNRKLEQINQILIIRPDADKLYIIERIETLKILWKNFEKLVLRIGRDVGLVKLAMQIANKGKYYDSEYEKLVEKARKLKGQIKEMLPDFFRKE